jgi:hypothetical protein
VRLDEGHDDEHAHEQEDQDGEPDPKGAQALYRIVEIAIVRSHAQSLPDGAPFEPALRYRRPLSTLEDHLRDKPAAVRALFDAFERLVGECGPYERSVTKTAIAYKGTVRGFAGVTPRPHDMTGFLDLTEEVHEPPFTRVSPYTKRLWVHRFVVNELGQLDDAFAARVAQAYAVGQGAHR